MNPNNHQHRHLPPQFPNPPPTHFPIPNPNPNFQPPPLDLSTALAALIHLTEHTLSSAPVSDLVRSVDKDVADGFSQCPYNPSHRLPASSLFSHYLTCPNSLDMNHLLSSLQYPNTLESSRSELLAPRAGISEDELCFSVDGYDDFCVNYYYKDCPGVVSLAQERDGEKRMFIVPRVLFMECKDFAAGYDELRELENSGFKFLASDFWLDRCEVDSWNDYPRCYSTGVLKMISNVCTMSGLELKKWVIVNSPSYGVVIDKAMRDHIVLLLKLCLRPMAKEAYKLVKSQMDLRVSKETGESTSMDITFECKIMNEVLGWFISQLTVLYGEVNGKYFGISMLKNCIVKAGLCSFLFPLEEKEKEPHVSKKSVENTNNHDCQVRDSGSGLAGKQDFESEMSEKVHDEIYFSQVAAAVAALYERMTLEQKIRGFRLPQPLPKHQIVAEHEYLTNKAREERQKRPNYRSIVEHDGLIWQHSRSQETNRKKTKEELLAEERDYKRRRMSYRGKKMKRSTTEVMRGIIEEYMEEIKHAGGIGCLVKGSEEARSFPHVPAHRDYANDRGIRSSYDISDKSRRQLDSIDKSPHPLNDRCESVHSLSSKDYKRQNSEAYGYAEHFENHRNSSSNRNDGDRISRSSSKGGSLRWSEDRSRRRIDHKENTKSSHESISFDTSSDWKSGSVSSSNTRKNMITNADDLESRHTGPDAFDDRYDPAFDDRYDPSNLHAMVEDADLT